MPDWMDRFVGLAEEQGITVRQTRGGTWVFSRKDDPGSMFTIPRTPATAAEWHALASLLRDLGVSFPDD